ncbi:MAG: iron complex transport system ATP-binding protein [Chloroflexota bacterium]|nr:iron complex transport system ATP-binding protein [Chloroflexota bacterium]
MSNVPDLSLRDVRFGYEEGTTVLDSLSLKIEPARITAILGPNGAGKTTLLNTILGYLKPQTGEVLLDGRDIAQYSKRELSQIIGLVPQAEHFPFNFTALEYILLGRTPYMGMFSMPQDEDYRAAQEIVELLNIAHLKQRPVEELSGGEQQLVLLARALAQEPKILLLDEPTTHLDLSNIAKLLNALKDLAKQDVTVVFTTHDPQAAVFCADQLVLMQAGSVVDAGSLEDILTSESLTRLYGVGIRVEEVDAHRVIFLT